MDQKASGNIDKVPFLASSMAWGKNWVLFEFSASVYNQWMKWIAGNGPSPFGITKNAETLSPIEFENHSITM